MRRKHAGHYTHGLHAINQWLFGAGTLVSALCPSGTRGSGRLAVPSAPLTRRSTEHWPWGLARADAAIMHKTPTFHVPAFSQ